MKGLECLLAATEKEDRRDVHMMMKQIYHMHDRTYNTAKERGLTIKPCLCNSKSAFTRAPMGVRMMNTYPQRVITRYEGNAGNIVLYFFLFRGSWGAHLRICTEKKRKRGEIVLGMI